MSKDRMSFGQAFVAAVFLMFGVMGIYGLWETFHYEKINVEPGIHEVAVSDFVHGRAWESDLGGQVAVFLMEDGYYWVWVGQRKYPDSPVHPTVKGKIVLACESRDEAMTKAAEVASVLAEGRKFFKTGATAYFLKPIRRSEFLGTEYNYYCLQSS